MEAIIVTERPATVTEDYLDPDERDDPKPAAKTRKPDKHLYQIDFVRLVTFASVILDHVILNIPHIVNMSTGAVGLMMRYTRYSFFALTGFVLTYQYRDRELKPLTFWRRRYKLIGLPFVTWSLFYWVYGRYLVGGWSNVASNFESAESITLAVKSICYDLITGNAWYHLYFLSVSMQIYLVFPGILWVLRRTWGYHRYLLAASFAFHLWLIYAMTSPPMQFIPAGVHTALSKHLVATIIPYQFFNLAGCVAAMHYPAFQAFMVKWRKVIIPAGIAVIAATIVYFVNQVDLGISIERASNVFLVHNVFAYIAVILILYCLGTLWQDRRRPGSVADGFMRTAADRSFGIYLAHALALSALMPIIREHAGSAPWPLLLLSFLGTVVLTVFIVEVLRRSPISLITTGRNRLDWRQQNAGRSLIVGIVAIGIGVAVRLVIEPLTGNLIIATAALLVVSAVAVFWRRYRDGKGDRDGTGADTTTPRAKKSVTVEG
ncbi:acyltransferase [Gordonia sp. NPDC003585]|uniref:acyltransferase n=1 Tax=Gordonia sp. NPDC003585 TaxID=3154275 RepID=UPI0033B375A7